MNKSPEIKNLASALAKFQADTEAVKKGAVNPFFKSHYADFASIVEAIKKPLSDNGLSFSQFPTGHGGLTTILMHSSGEWMEDTFVMEPVDAKPQSVGSAITYARRYALGAVLGLATEDDDDGNEASKPASKGEKGDFAKLMEIVGVSDAKTLDEFTLKIEKSSKYTKEQKAKFHDAVAARCAELKEGKV